MSRLSSASILALIVIGVAMAPTLLFIPRGNLKCVFLQQFAWRAYF